MFRSKSFSVPACSSAWKGSSYKFSASHKVDQHDGFGWCKTPYSSTKSSPWHWSDSYGCKKANHAPVIKSPATFVIDENERDVGTAIATDADGDTVTYSILGGADAALFDLDADTGLISFKELPDFETPLDAGGDNVYDIRIGASDGSATTKQNVSIIVQDVPETVNTAPVITGYTDFSRTGNQSVAIASDAGRAGIRLGETGPIGFATAFDADGDTLHFAISGGSDADLFSISDDGVLSANAPFALLGSADGDSTYDVVLSVTDDSGATAQLTLDYFVIAAA